MDQLDELWVSARERAAAIRRVAASDHLDRMQGSIQFGTGAGRVELIAELPGSRALEAAYHRRFADRRLDGEWFSPNDELVDLMRKWPPF